MIDLELDTGTVDLFRYPELMAEIETCLLNIKTLINELQEQIDFKYNNYAKEVSEEREEVVEGIHKQRVKLIRKYSSQESRECEIRRRCQEDREYNSLRKELESRQLQSASLKILHNKLRRQFPLLQQEFNQSGIRQYNGVNYNNE